MSRSVFRVVRPFWPASVQQPVASPASFSAQPYHARIRLYNTSKSLQDYPKEGVFQSNSPRSNPLTRTAQPQGTQPQDPRLQRQQSAQDDVREPSVFQYPSYARQPPRRSSRWRGIRLATGALYFCTVTALGFLVTLQAGTELMPLPLEPGSEDDREALAALAEEFDTLPIVQDLRSTYLKNAETGRLERAWAEWPAYRAFWDPTSPAASARRRDVLLSTGPYRGSRGLAAQTVFYNDTHKMFIVFINFGEAMCGWPGKVHGGAIATVFDEALARVAGRRLPAKTSVTANLEVSYQAPCQPGQWYALVVLSQLDDEHPAGSSLATGLSNREMATRALDALQMVRGAPQPTEQLRESGKAATPVDGEQPAVKPMRKIEVAGRMVCVDEQGPRMDDVMNARWTEPAESNPFHTHVMGRGLFVVPRNVDMESRVKPGEMEF